MSGTTADGFTRERYLKAPGFAPGERATWLPFAMHDALVRATQIERATLVAETLTEIVGTSPPSRGRAPRAVRRARAFLHDALATKVTLDDVAEHAAVDKFHLVRAFRAELGLPAYEYLTYLRVSRARELLRHGGLVAEAAQAVGFHDESQLHRHFRRSSAFRRASMPGASPAIANEHANIPQGEQAPGDLSSAHERTRSQ